MDIDSDYDSENVVLKDALSYAEMGWHVFPVWGVREEGGKIVCCCSRGAKCGRAGKHPHYAARRSFKDATTIESTIKGWFGGAGANNNIGIATGEESGITVIDIDVSNGKPGLDNWHRLNFIGNYNFEVPTYTVATPTGGLHLYYQYNKELKSNNGKLAEGIDVKNDRGYVVAPPSRHKNGGYYEVAEHWDIDLAEIPQHILNCRNMAKHIDIHSPIESGCGDRKYSLDEVKAMLAHVDYDDRENWRYVGIILGREFEQSDEAWELYREWADQWEGAKDKQHEEIMQEAFYEISKEPTESPLTIGTPD